MPDEDAPRARRVVVITGASAGIGRATALEFARHGWRVALLARGHDGLEAARLEVQQAGSEALVVPVDVADPAQVEAAAERVEREWGPIDAWINNAMATIFAEFLDVDPGDYRRATGAPSSRSARRWPTARSRCRRPIAARRRRFVASPIHRAANSSTPAAGCT